MEKLISMCNGHMMYESIYQKKMDYFVKCLEKAHIKVIESCKPYFEYDFTFLVSAKTVEIPKETLEYFGKAGLITKIEDFTDNNSTSTVDKTFIIRSKY